MKSTYIANNIYQVVKRAERVLLVPHQHPDGDALGAATAFASWLDQEGIAYDLFCHTRVTTALGYLPHLDQISHDPAVWEKGHDLIVVFDSGDPVYAGIARYLEDMSKEETPTIINIDHHITNQFYGAHNLVNTNASSTCEIVYGFFKVNNIAMSQSMATSLLTGIITDTDNFTNSATTPHAISVAAALTSLGANYNTIKDYVYKSIPLKAFELWGRMFARLTKHEPLNIVHTFMTQKDLDDYELEEQHTGGMTNFLNSLHDGHAGLILKETKEGHTKGSFRTNRDDVNVADMAKHFGGGGHRKAAGFTIEKPIHEAMAFILFELEQLFPAGLVLDPQED